MFTVKKKEHAPNMVWDAVNGGVLCHFVDGVFETDSRETAETLKALGHDVAGLEAETKARRKKAD